MYLLRWVCAWWCACAALGSVSVRRAGWMDRAVSYYRGRFLDDVAETAPVQLRASLIRAPAPAEEAAWDYAAVERLLALLGADEGAAPLRRALRRALRPSAPTRRFISKKDNWKLFPSLGKYHGNNIYYDYEYEDSGERGAGGVDYGDETVLVLENPVEARLPSARISVKLLREILENRARAARVMPSTVNSTIPWIPMNKTGSAGKNATASIDSKDSAGNGIANGDKGVKGPDSGDKNTNTGNAADGVTGGGDADKSAPAPAGGGEAVPEGAREPVPEGGGEAVPEGGGEAAPEGGGEAVPEAETEAPQD